MAHPNNISLSSIYTGDVVVVNTFDGGQARGEVVEVSSTLLVVADHGRREIYRLPLANIAGYSNEGGAEL
jgi:hypothetical protein